MSINYSIKIIKFEQENPIVPDSFLNSSAIINLPVFPKSIVFKLGLILNLYKTNKSTSDQSNIIYLGQPDSLPGFQPAYLSFLQKTDSTFSDEELLKLPNLQSNHPLYEDWKVRADSYRRLKSYFSKRKDKLILEIGAGNCWLANKLSRDTFNFVYALDINLNELEQASRVFADNKRIKFFCGSIFDDIFEYGSFDAIILASSLQYFDNFPALINRLIRFLKRDSEIHIFDSPIYKQSKIKNVKENNRKYFQKIGVPALANYYQYHSWKEFQRFRYKVLNRKNILLDKMLNKMNVKKIIRYPHILIKT